LLAKMLKWNVVCLERSWKKVKTPANCKTTVTHPSGKDRGFQTKVEDYYTTECITAWLFIFLKKL